MLTSARCPPALPTDLVKVAGTATTPARESPLTASEVVVAARHLQLGDGAGASVRLLPRLMDPRITLEALAALLAAEPALACRVLRVANAPYYGHAGKVATLARATELLGLDALRGVVAATCFEGMNSLALRPLGPDLVAFKRHSMASGVAAQSLARRLAPALAEQAFMVGLLHDLGLLLLWRLRPATMAARALSMDAKPPDLGDDLGIHHADCGRLMMETWSMPLALSEAVAAHESAGPTVSLAAAPDLGDLLWAGHYLATEAGFGLAEEPSAPTSRTLTGWEPLCAELAPTLPQAVERMATAFAH